MNACGQALAFQYLSQTRPVDLRRECGQMLLRNILRVVVFVDTHAAVFFQRQAAVAAGIQIGDYTLQYFTSLHVIPDLRIDRLLVRRRRRIHTRLHRHDLQEITREIPVAVDLNVRIVIFFNTIHADASGAALYNESGRISGRPLPAGARID